MPEDNDIIQANLRKNFLGFEKRVSLDDVIVVALPTDVNDYPTLFFMGLVFN